MKRSADASVHWLASKTDGNWLLFFDNADNVDLKLKQFFPTCSSGNILVTTRNRELRHYAAKDADADVKGMNLEDAKSLLLVKARAERSGENIALTGAIVQVNSFMFIFLLTFVLGPDIQYRNFTVLRWRSHKLVLLFTATRLCASIKNSTDVNATICCRMRRLKDRIHTTQLYIQRGD